MGVDLGGRNVGVAKQRLEHAQVGAPGQKVGGESVPQDVRADPGGRDARRGGHGADDLEQADPAEVGLAPGEQPGAVLDQRLAPFCGGGVSALRDRHEPFLAALALEDQERLFGAERGLGERDEFGGAQPRAVEEFEQGEVAKRGRGARFSAILGLAEHRFDFMRVEDSRQGALVDRAGQRGGGVVLAIALVEQEAIEAAKRGGAAGDSRRGKVAPSLAEPLQRVDIGGRDLAEGFGPGFEVAAIGKQGVARRACFGRHHVEEPVDQRAVVWGHDRLSASAAIIRALKRWPVSLSALTL